MQSYAMAIATLLEFRIVIERQDWERSRLLMSASTGWNLIVSNRANTKYHQESQRSQFKLHRLISRPEIA